MIKMRLVPALALTVVLGLACTGGDAGPEVLDEGNELLASGDLPGAYDKYSSVREANPDSIHAVNGAAYAHLLAGEYAEADNVLAAFEEKAGDKLGEIKLRRALVALQSGDLDAVKNHGKDSKLPAGLVLAAEVHLADAESDEAMNLLKDAASGGGPVADTAQKYLALLDSGDQTQAGLAEATALWALGQRDVACEAAEDLVKALPDDDDKGSIILLWAGRAVTSGRPAIAQSLLDSMDFPPEGQSWRVQATRAMIMVANGDGELGAQMFDALAQGGAPADGLADARATAAALTDKPKVAKDLVAGLESEAAARSLLAAGAGKAASDSAPGGTAIKQFLEGR